MVKAEVVIVCALVLCACSPSVTWQKYEVNASITGVTPPSVNNIHEALGVLEDSVYISPSGKRFDSNSASYRVAKELIAVQPTMTSLKDVVATSQNGMIRNGAMSELAYWAVDHITDAVESISGRRVDMGLINHGGIRVDLPKGEILKDDIVSMFPFKNHICWLAVKGSDLMAILNQIADDPQPISRAKIVAKNGKLVSALVGGEEVDPERIYGIATLDFLLTGGDGYYVARNAVELNILDQLVIDVMLPFVREYPHQGKTVDYSIDDRLTIE